LRRKHGGGADVRGVANLRRRAEELEPTSPVFFVFLSHDDVFIARQWR
jgi:hypothetical protein